MNSHEVGQNLIVKLVASDVPLAHQANVRKFVCESANQIHGIAELGTIDGDVEGVFHFLISACGTWRKILAGLIDEPQIASL